VNRKIKLKRAIWKNFFNEDPMVKEKVLAMKMGPQVEEETKGSVVMVRKDLVLFLVLSDLGYSYPE